MGLAFYVGRVPRSGKFLDIPFSQIATFVVGIMGGAYACTQLNTALWGNEPATLAKEWQAENAPLANIAVSCKCSMGTVFECMQRFSVS